MYVSETMCASFAFSLFYFLVCFVQFDLFVFILSSFNFLFLASACILMRKKKERVCIWEGGEDGGGVGVDYNQCII